MAFTMKLGSFVQTVLLPGCHILCLLLFFPQAVAQSAKLGGCLNEVVGAVEILPKMGQKLCDYFLHLGHVNSLNVLFYDNFYQNNC